MRQYVQVDQKLVKRCLVFGIVISIASVLVGPAFAQSSSNYKLKGYEFGSGGDSLNSTNYSLEGLVGENASAMSSSNYKANSGLTFVQNGNVPPAPTLVNDTGSRYNKLKITINKDAGDPTDAKYAIAISTDGFASDTRYVQNDTTIGTVLGIEDWQTYSSWGGASGTFVITLNPSTTYTVKVKSTQGKYTESAFGPTASAATAALKISFDIDIGGASDPGETVAPYAIAFSNLSAGSVITAANRTWIDFDTNAESGGFVYIYDQYAGLKSTNLNYTIAATTTDLTAVAEGFGLQGASKTQASGGPLAYASPYDGVGNNVGLVNSTIREIFTSSNNPIVSGRGSVALKAKAKTTTPGASDYIDTLTMIATAAF